MNNTVVVVAAHPDDEVLGCGGSLARFAAEGACVHILLLSDGESSRVDTDAIDEKILHRKKSAVNACETLGCTSVEVCSLPDNKLDTVPMLDIIQKVESYINVHKPRLVITHHGGDLNIDHQRVNQAVLTACRPQPNHPVQDLLFFETPSSTEWQHPVAGAVFAPNYFVDVSSFLKTKLKALKSYDTEMRDFPHPRSYRAIEALARWRGSTVGYEAAEAFVLGRKII